MSAGYMKLQPLSGVIRIIKRCYQALYFIELIDQYSIFGQSCQTKPCSVSLFFSVDDSETNEQMAAAAIKVK